MGDSKKKGSKRGGIATFSDLRHTDSDSDSEPAMEYYTGGEKSGMMVQDPNKPPLKKAVDAIFNNARRQGAEEAAGPPSQGIDNHVITFWTNGFTVDDGPLRSLDDPANAPFLLSIERGECPRELDSGQGSRVDMHLVKKNEEWKPPAFRAFQGAGRTLGASSSAPSSAPAPTSAPTSAPFVVDESKPFTTLQLRLADGTRLVARFNHSHTVADVRRFINAARTDGPQSYALQLMGSFPPTLLSEPAATLESAGLINAVVVQKV